MIKKLVLSLLQLVLVITLAQNALAASSLTVPHRPDEVQAANLKAYWKLDEASGTRADSSGNGNTLTDNNTVAAAAEDYWKTGENSADFEASNSEYLSRTDAAQVGLELNGTSFTVSAWVKPESFGLQNAIISKNPASNDGYLVYLPAGDTRVNVYLNGSLYQSATNAVTTGRWNHVCVVRDIANNRLMIYVNGNLFPTAAAASYFTATDVIAGNSEPVQVGRYGTSSSYFDGYMKDVAVWNVALTPLEVKSLALGINSTTYHYRPTALTTQPSSFWKFNEASNAAGAVSRADTSGSNTLTDNNTVVSGGGYFEGLGADFERDNSEYLSAGDIYDLNASSFSMSAWIKIESSAADLNIISKWNPSTGWMWRITNSLQGIQFWFDNSAQGSSTNYTFKTGTWYHIAVVFDDTANTLKHYVDGVVVQTVSSVTSNPSNTANNFNVGRRSDGSDYFDGIITDAAVWSTYAMTDAEVKSLASGLPVQQSGFVSYYKLNETSGNRADSYGTNTLTDNNSTGFSTGQVSNAADFESTNSNYLSITSPPTDLKMQTDFSVVFWTKPESVTSNEMYIVYNGGGFGNGFAFIVTDASGGTMSMYRDTAYAVSYTEGTLDDTSWKHIVGEWDGASYKLFLNSFQGNSNAGATPPTSVTTDFNIGRAGTNGRYIDGLLDEILIAKRYFREEEIKTIYNKGLNGKELTSSEANAVVARRRILTLMSN